MPELEPHEALVACERALRQLFARAYRDEYGAAWLTRVATEKQISAWAERREVEQRKRATRGVIQVPTDELHYAHFYDLVNIASQHWAPLAGALGKKSETMALLLRFDRLRDTVAHSRQARGFEADLLSGIAGQVRNQVTRYMTETDPSGDHYSRIESVMDSFGRESSGNPRSMTGSVVADRAQANVGDIVTFTCVGHDPQGRSLNWIARRPGGELVQQAEGERVTFRWTVRADDVGQATGVMITVAADSQYRRHGFGLHDDMVIFQFEVPPPR